MATSYFPTANMIRKLFFTHGFREPIPAEELRQGGFYFLRDHPDGRLQSAFVFSWSNFRRAEEQGILPCRLFVRTTLDAPRPDSAAIASANSAGNTFISYRKGEWADVCARFEQDLLPIFDAAPGEAETLQEEYVAVARPQATAMAPDQTYSV